MSCSVAVSNSPVFSPPSSLFCNKSSMISPSPETLNLATSSSSDAMVSCSSPSSPFRLRIPKPLSGLSASGPGSPATQLKRKRPAKLYIPVVSSSFGAAPAMESPTARREVVEADREGYYYVSCKRGRREALEDRYSATLNLQGDPKQVMIKLLSFLIL